MIAALPRAALLGAAAALLLAVLYSAYLGAVVGLLPLPLLAGVSGESAGRMTSAPPAVEPSFASVLEASTVVEGADGGRDIGVSAVAFNHFVAASGRAAPQLEWARARIDRTMITVEGELRGYLNVPFAGQATVLARDQALHLTLAVERFGILPLPGFLSTGREWSLEIPSSPLLRQLLGLTAGVVG